MDWAESEWKQGLPSVAVHKINSIEEHNQKLLKVNQQKQLQIDQMEQVLGKQKIKNDEQKSEEAQLNRELKSLSEELNDAQSQVSKLKNELAQREAKFALAEKQGKYNTGDEMKPGNPIVDPEVFQLRKIIEKLQSEIKTFKSETAKQESFQCHGSPFPDKIGTPSKSRQGSSSENQIEKYKSEKNQADEKVCTLEGKLHKLTQDLECQRHNFEAAKSALEMKFKERENNLKEEIKQQGQTISELDKLLNDAKGKLNQALNQIAPLESLKSAFEKEKQLVFQSNKEKQLLEHDLDTMSRKSKAEIVSLQNEVDIKQKQIMEIQNKLDASVKEMTFHIAATQELRKEIEKFKNAILNLEKDNDAAHSKIQNLTEKINSDINSHENELKSKQQQVLELTSKLNDSQKDIQARDEIIHNLKMELQAMMKEVEKLKSDLLLVQSERSSMGSQIEKIKSESKELQTELKESKTSIVELLKSQDLHLKEISLKEQCNSDLETKLKTMHSSLSEAMLNNTSKCETISMLEMKLIEVKSKLEEALEGLSSYNLLMSLHEDQKKQLLELSNEKESFNAKILNLNAEHIKQANKLKIDIESKTKLVVDLQSKMDSATKEISLKMESIDQLNDKLKHANDINENLNSHILVVTEENQNLKTTIEGNLKLHALEAGNLCQELKKLEEKFLVYQAEFETLQENQFSQIQENNQLKEINNSHEEKISELEKELSKCKDHLAEAMVKIELCVNIEKKLDEANLVIMNFMKEKTDLLASHNKLIGDMQSDAESTKIQLNAKVEELQFKDNIIKDLNKDIEAFKSTLELKNTNLDELGQRFDSKCSDVVFKDEELDRFHVEVGNLEKRIDSLQTIIDVLQEKSTSISIENVSLRDMVKQKDMDHFDCASNIASLQAENQIVIEERQSLVEEITFKNELLATLQEKVEKICTELGCCDELEKKLKYESSERLAQEKLKRQLEVDLEDLSKELLAKQEKYQQLLVSKNELEENLKYEVSERLAQEKLNRKLEVDLEELSKELEAKKEKYQQLLESKNELEENLKYEDSERLAQEKLNRKLEVDLEDLSKELEAKEEKYQQLLVSKNELEQSFKNEASERLAQEKLNRKLEVDLEDLSKELEAKEEKYQQLQATKNEMGSTLKAEIIKLESDCAKLIEQCRNAEEKFKSNFDLNQEREREKQIQQSRIETLVAEINQLQFELLTSHSRVSELVEIQILDRLASDDTAETLNFELQNLKDAHESDLNLLKAQLVDAENLKLALNRELEQLRKEFQMLEETNESSSARTNQLLEEARIKEDTLQQLERDNEFCVTSMVEKNNYVNSLQASLSQIRHYFYSKLSRNIITPRMDNKVPDNEIIECLLFELEVKKNTIAAMNNKLSRENVEDVKLTDSVDSCISPVDEILSKINELKVFLVNKNNELLVMKKEVDDMSGSRIEEDGSVDLECGDHETLAIASTSSSPETVNLKGLVETLANTLSTLQENVIKVKNGHSFEEKSSEVERLTKDVIAAEESKAKLMESIILLENERDQISKQLSNERAKMGELNSVLSEFTTGSSLLETVRNMTRKLVSLKKDLVSKDVVIKQLSSTIEEVEDNLEAVFKEKNDSDEKLSSLEVVNSSSLREISDLKEQLRKLNVQLESCQNDESKFLENEIKFLELETVKDDLEVKCAELAEDLNLKQNLLEEANNRMLTMNGVIENLEIEKRGSLDVLVSKNEALESELDRLNVELGREIAKNKQISRLEEELKNQDDLLSKVSESDVKISQLEACVENSNGEIAGLRRKNEHLENEVQLARNYADEVVEELSKFEETSKENENLKITISQLRYENDHLKECLQTVEKRNNELEERLRTYQNTKEEISNLSVVIRDLELKLSETDGYKTELDGFKLKWDETEFQMKKTQDLVDELRSEKEKWLAKESEFLILKEELDLVKSLKAEAEVNLQRLRGDAEMYEVKFQNLRDELDNKEITVKELASQMEDLKNELDDKVKLLQNRQVENEKMKHELNQVSQKYENENMEVMAQMNRARNLYGIVKEKDNRDYNLKDLLNLTEQAFKEIREELDEHKSRNENQSLTLFEKESEIEKQNVVIQKHELTLEEQKLEIANLTEQIRETNALENVLILERRVEVLQSELRIVRDDNEQYLQKCNSMEADLVAECDRKERCISELQEDISRKENLLLEQVKILDEQLRQITLQKFQLQETCDKLTEELLSKANVDTSSYLTLKESFSEKERELSDAYEKLAESQLKNDEFLEKLQNIETSYNKSQEEAGNFQKLVEELRLSNSELEKDKNSLKGKIFLGNKMLKRGENDRRILDNDNKLLKISLDELKAEKEKIDKVYQELDNKNKELDKQLKSVQKKLETQEIQISALKLHNSNLTTDVHNEREAKANLMKQLEDDIPKATHSRAAVSLLSERIMRNRKPSQSPTGESGKPSRSPRRQRNGQDDITPDSKVRKMDFHPPSIPMTRAAHRRSLSAETDDGFKICTRKSLLQPMPASTARKPKENKPHGLSFASHGIASQSNKKSVNRPKLNPPSTAVKRPLKDNSVLNQSDMPIPDDGNPDCKVQ